MFKKSVRARFVIVSTLSLLCCLSIVRVHAQKGDDDASLIIQFRQSTEKEKKCGDRSETLRVGKLFIEKYANDQINQDVVAFVKRKIAEIEKQDPICRRNERYYNSFKAKNWQEVFAEGKKIIAEEENSSVALDVMLDFVSIGYDRALFDKIDTFNNDTLLYAKLAIQRIEGKHASNSGKYGALMPFGTKDEALGWMNYIAGWILYSKMNQKKDALPYFYKATQFGIQKKNDTTIYTNIGSYYFDEAVRLDTEYRDKRRANNNEDSDETKALLALARGTAERSMFYFAKAYKIAADDSKLAQLKANLRKTLIDLYRFRFNVVEVDPIKLDLFIERLNDQPSPDTLTPIQPD